MRLHCVVTVGVPAIMLLASFHASAQSGQGSQAPAYLGLPFPPSATQPNRSSSPLAPDPNVEREMVKHMRIHNYKRMQEDTHTIQRLAAELSRQAEGTSSGTSSAGAAGQHAEVQPEQAMKDAQKITKLAAEIDRLMRQE